MVKTDFLDMLWYFSEKNFSLGQLEIHDSYYFHYHDTKNRKWGIRYQELILGFPQWGFNFGSVQQYDWIKYDFLLSYLVPDIINVQIR